MNPQQRNLSKTSPSIPLLMSKPITLPAEVIEAMSNNKYNYVSIRKSKWKELNLSQVITFVVEWSLNNGLFLCSNQQVGMLAMISHVRFPKLKKLEISGNGIESIELISRMYLPCLEKLNLKDNQIINIAALRRSNIPNLQHIDIWGNAFNSINSLSELHATNLKSLSLEYYDDTVYCNDSRAAAKLESISLNKILLLSEFRIPQSKFFQTMVKRCKESQELVELYRPQANQNN